MILLNDVKLLSCASCVCVMLVCAVKGTVICVEMVCVVVRSTVRSAVCSEFVCSV